MSAEEKSVELKTDIEASQKLKVSPGTLAVWRSTKRYPLPFVKMGSRIFYRESDLEAFIASRVVNLPKAEPQSRRIRRRSRQR
jgi:hypothetical protein